MIAHDFVNPSPFFRSGELARSGAVPTRFADHSPYFCKKEYFVELYLDKKVNYRTLASPNKRL
jgi:hypothetical protein